MVRLAACLALGIGLIAAACAGTPSSPSPIASSFVVPPSPSTSPSPPPSPSPSPNPSPGPSPSPSPSRAPSVGPSGPAAPTIAGFWRTVEGALEEAGRVEVTVDGPSPGRLRYEATRSATVIDGQPTFVCVGTRAYDGQSGWDRVPGTWSCGPEALTQGFRTIGQPLDAWNASLPSDAAIEEETSLVGTDLDWRWTYQARSPFAGQVKTVIVADRATGRILSAVRTDTAGETVYRFDYDSSFPPIVAP